MSVGSGQQRYSLPDSTAANPGGLEVSQGPQVGVALVSGGTVTLNGTSPQTVVNANVTAKSIIIFTLKTVGGTVSPNAPNVLTITAGTGFTCAGTALDTSIYNYVVIG